MQQIIYVSQASQPFSTSALAVLQQQAATKNSAMAITGLLLFRQNYFCQLLEGPTASLLPLYQKIQKDKRHKEVTTLLQREIATRAFPEWDMLLMNVDIQTATLPDFTPLPILQGMVSRASGDHGRSIGDPQLAFDLLLAFSTPFFPNP